MFVALRDLKNARGRFVLMSVVIVLITFLVTFLASLTAGLARESTSAVTDLPADHLVFSMPQAGDAPEFTASRVSADDWEAWADVPGVESAQPWGVATTRAESGGATASVTALGVDPASTLLPEGAAAPSTGSIVLTSDAAAALGSSGAGSSAAAGTSGSSTASVGDTVTVGGVDLTVSAVVDADESFSHTPVVWTSLDDWQSIGAQGVDPSGGPVATAVALTTSPGVDDASLAATDSELGTTTVTTSQARSAVPSFAGENTSLSTMQAFLLLISALVVGAFFTVWTISRSGDIAVLKALGASTRYLLKDALGQATVLLVGGVAIGTTAAALAAAVLPDAVPVAVTLTTTLLPAAALVVLGLVGAAVSVARITRVDPHAALAAR